MTDSYPLAVLKNEARRLEGDLKYADERIGELSGLHEKAVSNRAQLQEQYNEARKAIAKMEKDAQ